MSKFDNYLATYKDKHQDKYDYSDTIFTGVKNKIRIYCNVHNKHFEQMPRDHLTSTGCTKCKSELISSGNKSRTKNDTDYLDEMNTIHENKYTYNLLSQPTKKSDKISINCPIHGEFKQQLRNHLNGMGCKICADSNRRVKNDFIDKALALELPIDYSKVQYVNMITNVTLICTNCGHEWNCRPTYHLSYKKGCLKCSQANRPGWTFDSFNKLCKDGRATLYLLKMFKDNEEFFKIGITSNTVKQRYSDSSKLQGYQYEVLYETTADVKLIWNKESKIKKMLKELNIIYKPLIKFGGSTQECFKCDNINEFLMNIM